MYSLLEVAPSPHLASMGYSLVCEKYILSLFFHGLLQSCRFSLLLAFATPHTLRLFCEKPTPPKNVSTNPDSVQIERNAHIS
jgi:hypothetical protein